MQRAFFYTVISIATLTCVAQPLRLELLSRSGDHARRKGGGGMSTLPEFSRDGNYVLFLSHSQNLTTDRSQTKPALNLYMTDRRTLQTTLVSKGTNGEPANDSILGFEISANNRRILLETAASNMVANDTNNVTDVFVRDLDLATNFLVSVNTNGTVGRLGANSPSMSADGNTVVFTSNDKSLATDKSTGISAPFVRDIGNATTRMLKPPTGFTAQFARDIALSENGRFAAYTADVVVPGTSTLISMNVLYDLNQDISIHMAEEFQGYSAEPIITPDAKYATFGIFSYATGAVTNVIVRYHAESGTTDLVASNNFTGRVELYTRPVAISDDGKTILYLEQNGYRVYREGLETRVIPKASDGSPMELPTTFGMSAMSADGKFVTFSTDVPLLATDGQVSQFQTYIYDVEQDQLAEIPLTSPTAPPSAYAVPNADGSIVVFSSANAEIQEEAEPATQNIYAWDRATGAVTLLSQSHPGAYENTSYRESKLSERAAISDDGQKIVFASRLDAANAPLNVFVLNRATGRKELVSLSADGQSPGSGSSMQPIISGNGQMVAFVSFATNLVGTDTQGRLQLYVRDLVAGTTRLVRNKDGAAPARGPVANSLSFSADGKLLCFASAATDLDPRDSQPQADVFVYDITSDTVTLVTFDQSNTTGADSSCYSPVISRDGKYVAFRSNARNLGIQGTSLPAFVRTLQTGALRMPNTPVGFNAVKSPMQFNPSSGILYFSGPNSAFFSFNVTNGSTLSLVSNAIEASPSADGKWIAFTRRDTTPAPSRLNVYLRNMTNGVETLISSSAISAGPGNDWSYSPRISPDGRFAVFESRATNLVVNDRNAAMDLFLYDRVTGHLDLVSAASNGAPANSFSLRPVMSPDNSFVAFVSYATDLISHDYNDGADIFAAYFPAPDSDADGIDDRWELAEFGDLNHDMDADTDGDGMSDAAEFAAQTDPNHASSTLRLISAEVDETNNIVVRWMSTPGRAYKLQSRARFDAASQWQDVTDEIVSSSTESAITLPSAIEAEELYFRIVTIN